MEAKMNVDEYAETVVKGFVRNITDHVFMSIQSDEGLIGRNNFEGASDLERYESTNPDYYVLSRFNTFEKFYLDLTVEVKTNRVIQATVYTEDQGMLANLEFINKCGEGLVRYGWEQVTSTLGYGGLYKKNKLYAQLAMHGENSAGLVVTPISVYKRLNK
jgi:hypothetical protein